MFSKDLFKLYEFNMYTFIRDEHLMQNSHYYLKSYRDKKLNIIEIKKFIFFEINNYFCDSDLCGLTNNFVSKISSKLLSIAYYKYLFLFRKTIKIIFENHLKTHQTKLLYLLLEQSMHFL